MEESMASGACSLSSGLRYTPSCYADGVFSDLERKELSEVLEWVEEKIRTNAGVSALRQSAPEPPKRRR